MTPDLWRGGINGLGVLCIALELLVPATTVVMGGIGVLLCLLGPKGFAPASTEPVPQGAGQVTIRLESASFRLLRKHRCVVTVRDAAESSRETDREIWYAKHGR